MYEKQNKSYKIWDALYSDLEYMWIMAVKTLSPIQIRQNNIFMNSLRPHDAYISKPGHC